MAVFSERLRIIGAKVAFYRKIKCWTQLDLAEASGLSEDYVCKVENGRASGLTIVALLMLSKALGRELEDLTSM